MGFQDIEEKIDSRNFLNFKTNAANININQEKSLIRINWEKVVDPEDFKLSYQLAADLVKRFRIRNMLNDARNMAYLNLENQNWISRCILPQLVQSHLLKMARVVLDEPLAILVACNILDKITNNPEQGSKLSCEIFTDLDNALFWLNY
jgi:hypothetical protein